MWLIILIGWCAWWMVSNSYLMNHDGTIAGFFLWELIQLSAGAKTRFTGGKLRKALQWVKLPLWRLCSVQASGKSGGVYAPVTLTCFSEKAWFGENWLCKCDCLNFKRGKNNREELSQCRQTNRYKLLVATIYWDTINRSQSWFVSIKTTTASSPLGRFLAND